MGTINPTLPTPGDKRGPEETDVRNVLTALLTLVNGQLDTNNILDGSLTADDLAAAVRDAAGVNSTGVARRGSFSQPLAGARTNVAYGALDNGPDQVQNIVVPSGGRLLIAYQALVKQSVASAASVAIFIGATQLQRPIGTGVPAVNAGTIGADVNDYNWLYTIGDSASSGFVSAGGAGDASSVATGMNLSRMIEVSSLAGGTYTVSVQFKSTSGSVTAKERSLWVKAEGY